MKVWFNFKKSICFGCNIVCGIWTVGGWMQSCSECWIFNRWICDNHHHEEVASHMGDSSHAHWNLQIPSLVGFVVFSLVMFIWFGPCCYILTVNMWYCCRSDVVEIETWCQGEGRIGTRRDWILKDCATGQVIGRATRYLLAVFAVQLASVKEQENLNITIKVQHAWHI